MNGANTVVEDLQFKIQMEKWIFGTLPSTSSKVADSEAYINAQIPYKYAARVLGDNEKSVDAKEEIVIANC